MARTNAQLTGEVRYEFREGYQGKRVDPGNLMAEADRVHGDVARLAEWSKSHKASASWRVAGWGAGVHAMALRHAEYRLRDALGAIRPITARELTTEERTEAIRRAPPALVAIDGQMITLEEVLADPEALEMAWKQALGELRGWRRRSGHLVKGRRLREALEVIKNG